jgi:isopentenyl diphosphate isomerase/L-lactate dehydrogenase-like FMN-dependent dehydrogenase
VYRFIEGGTEEELTVRANREAFQAVTFRPRAAVAPVPIDLSTTVLGDHLSMPIAVAPAGMLRLARRHGDMAAARAAGVLGTAAGVSTMSSYPIEEISAATTGPLWYQVYFAAGRDAAERAIERAAKAGCTALLVTVDLAAAANREERLRTRSVPRNLDLRTMVAYAPEMVLRPRWVYQFTRDGLHLDLPNVDSVEHVPISSSLASNRMRREAPTWGDLAWIRDSFPGRIAVKGVLTPDDARRAADHGADAIVVSNHGGFALDSSPATIRMLPSIAQAVGDDIEVLMDGGIRRGVDVVKALAMGARAVLVGRAYVWALAAAGESGVIRILEILREGTLRTLALLGCPSLEALDESYVDFPREWLDRAPNG